MKKEIAGPVSSPNDAGKMRGRDPMDGIHNLSIRYKAKPPSHVCIPNHPHATTALKIAGIFAPFTPKLALANTGKEMPYFAPAWPFKIIGTSTTVLPKKMVSIACHQFIPPPINELAIM